MAATRFAEPEYRAVKPAIATIEVDRKRVKEHDRRLHTARETAARTAGAVAGLDRPDLATLLPARDGAAEDLRTATEASLAAKTRADQLTSLRDRMQSDLARAQEAEERSGPLRGLAALVNGANAQRLDLETFAIGAMFDLVLEAANLRLRPMTAGRYRIECAADGGGRSRFGLGIQVFDAFTGRARATSTLSGGETFIAALALALGLADVIESRSGKVRLDTIFIDEGFGSLDTENGAGTLVQVLQVLNGLVSQNRAMGLISHVPLVQEAIPNGFYIRKGPAGSRVETRGPV